MIFAGAFAAAGLALAGPVTMPDGVGAPREARFDGATLLQAARSAEVAGDAAFAETGYRALTADHVLAVRNEARFRLAALFAKRGRWSAAALLLRRILDEEPASPRVRFELAGLLAQMGHEGAARREIRAAQAARPPAALARLVDRFAAALRDRRPLGMTMKVALVPDSNISASTSRDRLETVIGDFSVDEDSRARSGMGIAMEGMAFGRLPLDERWTLISQAGIRAVRYKETDFNRLQLAVRGGAQVEVGRGRVSLTLAHQRQRLGDPTTFTATGMDADILHPLGKRTQGRMAIGVSRLDSRLNDLEDGQFIQLVGEVEHALSPVSLVGMTLTGGRRLARDPAFSNRSIDLRLTASHEVAQLTVEGAIGAGLLTADERLVLFPDKRRDRSWSFALGLTSRHISWRGLSPSLRLTMERTHSSIAYYDVSRRALEIGLTRSF